MLNDPKCDQVILFATSGQPTADFSESDGGAYCLPLVTALAKSTVGTTDVFFLFDGSFLTAYQQARSMDVRALLDHAQDSGKVSFYFGQVPFTSRMQPEDAVKLLRDIGPLTELTPATRARYFYLLSSLPEEAHGKYAKSI